MSIRFAVLLALTGLLGCASAQTWKLSPNGVELAWKIGSERGSGTARRMPAPGTTENVHDARGAQVGELTCIDGRIYLYTTPAGVPFGLKKDGTLQNGFVGRWALRSAGNESVYAFSIRAKTSDVNGGPTGYGFIRRFPNEGETLPVYRISPGQTIASAPIDGSARTIGGNVYVYGSDPLTPAGQLLPSGNLLPPADPAVDWAPSTIPGAVPAVAASSTGSGTGSGTTATGGPSLLNIGSGFATSAPGSPSGSAATGGSTTRPAGASPVSPSTSAAPANGGVGPNAIHSTTRPIPPPPVLGAAPLRVPPTPERF